MATLDPLALSGTSLSHSTSKSTSTPVSIEIPQIPIPENEDTDITHTNNNTLHMHRSSIHSFTSYNSFNSSVTTTPIITPSITPINDINDIIINDNNNNNNKKVKKLRLKKSASSSTKHNKYYRNLRNSPITHSREQNIEIHAKRKYKLDDGRIGICQFIGQTSFAKGIWVGIVLQNGAYGNTNGTVYGRKYFQCRDGKGLFVRPNKIIQALGRSSVASSKKQLIVNTNHHKSISDCSNKTMLTMSTSSPLHFSDNIPNFDSLPKLDEPTKLSLNNQSQSVQKPYKNNTKSSKKYKSKLLPSKQEKKGIFTPKTKLTNSVSEILTDNSDDDIIDITYNIKPEPIATSFKPSKKQKPKIVDDETPFTPLTPMTPPFDNNNLGSRSADNSPYTSRGNTPRFNDINSPQAKFADIPIISIESVNSPILTIQDTIADSPLCNINNNEGEPIDAFSALRAYFSDEYKGKSFKLNDNNNNIHTGWGSSDESEGARSDSMLDDEDWVNKQHRARQESLAQTFADALTIPALHPVQQKMAYYIGKREKWKPPKYDMVPDHSNILTEKLLHHKKHLDENINDGRKVPKKLGPTDIGTVHGFKLPKYETKNSSIDVNSFKPNGTFLDKDKGWYHKPSKLNNKENEKHVKSQSVDYKRTNSKKSDSKKKTSQMSFDEEKETNEYEYKKKDKSGKIGALKHSKSTTDTHQRSQSELVRSKVKVKKTNDTKQRKKWKADPQEWLEDDMTWVPKIPIVKSKIKKRKLGPRDIGRIDYKGINDDGNNNHKKQRHKLKRKKNRKSRIFVSSKSENNHDKIKKHPERSNNLPNRISLPPMKIDSHAKKTRKMDALSVSTHMDTPQSTYGYTSESTVDSISPYFITDMKLTPYSNISTMSITPLEEFMTMKIVEDDEEDDDKSIDFNTNEHKSSVVPKFQDNNNSNNSETDAMPFIVDISFKMGNINNNQFDNNNNNNNNNNQAPSISSGGSVGSLFMIDNNVILEDSDMEFQSNNNTMASSKRTSIKNHAASYSMEMSTQKNEFESITTKKQQNKKKNRNNKRSRSLFSGSSDKKEKLKQHKAAKEKYKKMNSAKTYVQNVNNKSDKSDRKKRRTKMDNHKKKLRSKKKKKNKIWKKGNIKKPPL